MPQYGSGAIRADDAVHDKLVLLARGLLRKHECLGAHIGIDQGLVELDFNAGALRGIQQHSVEAWP